MVRKIFYFVVLLLCYFVTANQAAAAGEFTADYDVSYTVATTGVTIVTHRVSLTNKLTNLYAREYSIVFDSTKIRNIVAYDDGGQITPEITEHDGKTEIKLAFNTQVIGIGKKLTFTLRFENEEIAQKLGSIWEVHIPGVANDPDLGTYFVSLAVPPSFGPVAYMSPEPSDGKRWNREQMTHGGVSLGYGNKQQFLLDLSYYIENPSVTAKSVELALPPDTAYQKVTIGSLDPKPDEVVRDADGNWLARYTLGSRKKQDVAARLYVAITLEPRSGWTDTVDVASSTKADRYWESTDPAIISIANKLRTPKEIYTYVVGTLSYDYNRVNQNPIRKGARAALSSPKASVCMEFTDLFIAIARAAHIPAREVVGYAYTTNTKLRPLSLVTDVLHSWPEYYDQTRQLWIPVDPTWADTTGGIDYFTKLDFNHIAFAVRGQNSQYPYPAGFYRRPDKSARDVSVTFADVIPEIAKTPLTVSIAFPTSVISGLETAGTVKITNTTAVSVGEVNVSVQSTPVDVALFRTENVLPPFGTITLPFQLASGDYFFAGRGRITVAANDQISTHQFTIRPTYWLLIPGGLVVLVSVAALFLITRKPRTSHHAV